MVEDVVFHMKVWQSKTNFVGKPITDSPLRLSTRYFPSLYTLNCLKTQAGRRQCHVCSHTTRRERSAKYPRYQ
jgi:hypothetical protein